MLNPEQEKALEARLHELGVRHKERLDQLRGRLELREMVAQLVAAGRTVAVGAMEVALPIAGNLLREALMGLLNDEIRRQFGEGS